MSWRKYSEATEKPDVNPVLFLYQICSDERIQNDVALAVRSDRYKADPDTAVFLNEFHIVAAFLRKLFI